MSQKRRAAEDSEVWTGRCLDANLGDMPKSLFNPVEDLDAAFDAAALDFWTAYYSAIRDLHARQGRGLTEPIKDRNLGTTASEHVSVFERFWREMLAHAIGVGPSEVGSRTIRFREHRTKSFDVCYPLTGDPKILISVKSMQNAYRNITNRIEEAFGDSAVLRLYKSNAVFGFFFFVLDGKVARGQAEQSKLPSGDPQTGKGKGVAPFLELIHEGGDSFDMSDAVKYRKPPSKGNSKGSQDNIEKTALSLLDLLADEPSKTATLHYDAIAYVPTRVWDEGSGIDSHDWKFTVSDVDERLRYGRFLPRLIEAAKLRNLL